MNRHTTPPETPAQYIERTGCLRRFTEGQRVLVIDENSPLHGQLGTTVRVCIAGLGPWGMTADGTFWNVPEAWVKMDRLPPAEVRRFPADDSRGHNVRLCAAQCTQGTP